MKTATLPPIRIEPELRADLESVLDEGENISSFTEAAVRAEVNYRKVRAEFLARSRKSLQNARRTRNTRKTIPASDVLAMLDAMLAEKKAEGKKESDR